MSNQPYTEPDVREPVWADDDGLFADERSTAFPPDTLVTFRFIRDAIRRHLRIWLVARLRRPGRAAWPRLSSCLHRARSRTRLLLTHRDGRRPGQGDGHRRQPGDHAHGRTAGDRAAEAAGDTGRSAQAVQRVPRRPTGYSRSPPRQRPDGESTRLATVIAQVYLALPQGADLAAGCAAPARPDVRAERSVPRRAGGSCQPETTRASMKRPNSPWRAPGSAPPATGYTYMQTAVARPTGPGRPDEQQPGARCGRPGAGLGQADDRDQRGYRTDRRAVPRASGSSSCGR